MNAQRKLIGRSIAFKMLASKVLCWCYIGGGCYYETKRFKLKSAASTSFLGKVNENGEPNEFDEETGNEANEGWFDTGEKQEVRTTTEARELKCKPM